MQPGPPSTRPQHDFDDAVFLVANLLVHRGRVFEARRMRNDDADRWRLRSIIDALAKMQPAPAAAPQIDPELAELYMRFDESEAAMKKLKTVDARRKASRTMAPLLA